MEEDDRMHSFRFLSVLLSLLIVLSLTSIKAEAQVELVENGGFETGDFTGWTVVQEPGSNGDWAVYSGTVSPISGAPILPPPEGNFAATSDQTNPSSQVLFQNLDIPTNSTVTCSVIVYYFNLFGSFINGADLSYLTIPNQQARIDIMDPSSPDFDIGTGVFLNVFQTNPGDPPSIDYTAINFELSDFAGTTVRFRAAEVDNQMGFRFSIDNLTCTALPIISQEVQIPTLSEWGMIAMAGILGLMGFMAIRRKKATS